MNATKTVEKMWRVTLYTSSDRKHVLFSDVVAGTSKDDAMKNFRQQHPFKAGYTSAVSRELRPEAKWGRTGW